MDKYIIEISKKRFAEDVFNTICTIYRDDGISCDIYSWHSREYWQKMVHIVSDYLTHNQKIILVSKGFSVH